MDDVTPLSKAERAMLAAIREKIKVGVFPKGAMADEAQALVIREYLTEPGARNSEAA